MRAWCGRCDEPATLKGPAWFPPELQNAVHAATGSARGPVFGQNGTHACVPTDVDPLFRAQAVAVAAGFPRYDVSARFGIFRAVLKPEFVPPGATPVPVDAHSAGELTAKLAEAERSGVAVTA